jgi:hypothetical protein
MLFNSEQAVLMAKRHFQGATLDYSPKSLEIVEAILGSSFEQLPPVTSRSRADEETTTLVASSMGAYVGEVMRRNLGGAWVYPSAIGDTPGIRLPDGSQAFPISKAFKRLKNGREDDIVFYFRALANGR